MKKTTPDPKCPQCGGRTIRQPRKPSYLQTKLLPMLGYFPWECTDCRNLFLAKNRGPRKRRTAPPESTMPPTAGAGSAA